MTTATYSEPKAPAVHLRERTLWGDAVRRFARNKLSVVALLLALFLIALALLAPFLAPEGYDDQNYNVAWQFPSGEFPLGTDQFGRSLLSRIVYGARISLSVALVVNAVAFLVGVPIGALAGWYGGVIDYVLMRLVDVMSAFPTLLFALLLLTTIGSGLLNLYLALSITSWIGVARLIRGQFLSLREQEYVVAAHASGVPTWQILWRHMTPNALAPVIVTLTLGIPGAIMGEAGLSFLGIGVDPPTPSWGKMVSEYLPYVQTHWYLSTFPAIMIALTMYAFTLMGDGLQDALNPRIGAMKTGDTRQETRDRMTQSPNHLLLAELRAALPVTERCAYLQTGSLGPLSQPVLQAIQEAEWLAAQEGPAAPDGLTPLVAASEGAQVALARLLHVPATELAWSLNTSTAMRTVIHSLRLTSADQLITSDQEHVATRSLYNGLRDELGLAVVVLSTAGQTGDLLARLEAALRQPGNGRKVVLLSHVSCIDGRRLPVAEAVALTRRWGGISLIDGAQAVGQFPVDLQQINADFYIGSGHKWLLGPSGVGYIHVHRERLASFNPNWLPDTDRRNASAATLGEAGTTNLAQRAGVQVAVEQMLAIGLERVETHCMKLAHRLRAGLTQQPKMTLLGPDDPAQTTGLIGFTVQGWVAEQGKAYVDQLYRNQRILIKYQPEQTGLRVSLAAFNTIEEVESLLAQLANTKA